MPNQEIVKRTVKGTADLVKTYATNLLNDARAQQFYAQVSVITRNNPKLANCTPDSLLAACMACVHLDLMPNTPQQFAFIIPYGNVAQFQLGYRGMLKLAYRSGEVKSLRAELVFKGDYFRRTLGLKPTLTHRPSDEVNRTDYSLVTGVYAVAEMMNGAKEVEYMTRDELDKVQNVSKAGREDSPWKIWPESMAKKTVLKRLAKTLPSSNEDSQMTLASQFDSWAEAQKLGVQEGNLVELSEEDKESLSKLRRERIMAAEEERRKLLAAPTEPDWSSEGDADQSDPENEELPHAQ